MLDRILEEGEGSVQSLVRADALMGTDMKAFLLRCLDMDPNTRPLAFHLMSDPWLEDADQQVHFTACFRPLAQPCLPPRIRVYEIFYNRPPYVQTCPS